MPLISTKTKKNLVVGAGFSGAVMAERLASVLNEDVLVVDKTPRLAGICFDYKENGINIHKFGSHIFHTNHDFIWKYLNRFSKFDAYFHKVQAYMEGHFVTVPLNLNSLYELFSKPLAERLENKLIKKYGYGASVPFVEFKTKFFLDKDLDFLASYVFQNIFKGMYQKRKGASFDALNAFIDEKISISVSYDTRFYKGKYQGIPVLGYSRLIENMLNHKNIRVLTGTDFKTVDIASFDRVFYTGSIDEFFDFKYGKLNYRSADFEFEELELEKYQNSGVVSYPNDCDFIKIHEFKHYNVSHSPKFNSVRSSIQNGQNVSKTIIAKEYPTDFALGRNERLYPVLDEKNLRILNKYKTEAKKLNDTYFFGRLGDFKYYSMDGAIKRALELFDTVKFKAAIDFCKEQDSVIALDRV